MNDGDESGSGLALLQCRILRIYKSVRKEYVCMMWVSYPHAFI